jgi:phage shock protein A
MNTINERQGMLARFGSLLRGFFSGWVRGRENRNPELVYEQAIEGRVRQYRELKKAVAGILYMRTKLESEINERRAEIARRHDDIRRAVRSGQEEMAVMLIAQKQALFEDLERAEQELENVRGEAEEAKQNLTRFREEIRLLVREKGRMLASLANAQARHRLQLAVEGMSVDAEMAALESVREHVGRLSTEGQLDKELGEDGGMRQRLRAFRDDARQEAARAEFAQLKAELDGHIIPTTVRHVVPVATS